MFEEETYTHLKMSILTEHPSSPRSINVSHHSPGSTEPPFSRKGLSLLHSPRSWRSAPLNSSESMLNFRGGNGGCIIRVPQLIRFRTSSKETDFPNPLPEASSVWWQISKGLTWDPSDIWGCLFWWSEGVLSWALDSVHSRCEALFWHY